jgi:hypothetical protein
VPFWLRHPRYAVYQLAGIPALSARYEPVRVRAAPLTDLHHLQGIGRHVSRHQDRVKYDSRTETALCHRSHDMPHSRRSKTVDSSPHERFVASQRIKRIEAFLDEPGLVKLPPLTKNPLTAFLRSQRVEPEDPFSPPRQVSFTLTTLSSLLPSGSYATKRFDPVSRAAPPMPLEPSAKLLAPRLRRFLPTKRTQPELFQPRHTLMAFSPLRLSLSPP